MKIFQEIRKIINKNRLYSWMAVFIIFIQAYAVLTHDERPLPEKDGALTREEFRTQLERRREALEEILRKEPHLAMNFGLLVLFMLTSIIMGAVFLIDYLGKKRARVEVIPRTLEMPAPLWGPGDVLKVIILFVFFSHFFFIFTHILSKVTSFKVYDKRMGMVVYTGFMDLLTLLFIFRVVTVRYRQDIRALGISAKGLSRNIGVALYSYIGFLPVLAILFVGVFGVARALNYTPPPEPIYELIFEEERPILLAVITVLVSVAGPVIEEVFFRGFLYGALRKKAGITRAIFFSAFLFSFLHTNVIGFIPIMALGVLLAYLREKTNSLIPPIAVHIIHNTALALLMFLIRGVVSRAL